MMEKGRTISPEMEYLPLPLVLPRILMIQGFFSRRTVFILIYSYFSLAEFPVPAVGPVPLMVTVTDIYGHRVSKPFALNIAKKDRRFFF